MFRAIEGLSPMNNRDARFEGILIGLVLAVLILLAPTVVLFLLREGHEIYHVVEMNVTELVNYWSRVLFN